MIFLYKVIRSFKYATQGVLTAVEERNMKVHVFGALCAVILGILLKISTLEWTIVTMLIGMIFAAEMVNTAVEELSNIIRDELKLPYKATQRARDVAAGAVLVLSIVACIIGFSIFLPKLLL